jgi:NADH-quinone oxidoreductase subunit N
MMIAYEHLIMLFLGVETLTVAMYILTASDKRNLRSNEAALKYFLMGAFMTGIMLFGITLLYGATGSFTITQIMSYSTQGLRATQFLLYAGMFLLLIGMLFKVSAAPFHFWTPDVYDGAPTIFTSFMSTVVKVAGFAAVYRLLSHAFVAMQDVWWVTLAAMTVLTLLAGNITAVYQNSFKRMLAYSSISHAGYLMIALTALTATTQQAVLFYSLAYVAATVAAFGVLLLIAKEKSPEERFNESFDAFNGLAKNNPLLAFVLTVSMLSLAGIPLTAGFWGKFFVFSSAVERGGLTWLLVVAVLMSAVGIYYYLRVVIAAYFREGNTPTLRIAPFYKVALLLATATTILLGIMPGLVEQLW